MIHSLGLGILGEIQCAIRSNRISVYLANTATVSHLMWWLALKTETSVSLSDESTSITSSTRQPLLHSILSVAFSVIYSESNLARSPFSLLSDIARKFFQFFVKGILPPSMTRLWAELFLYFAFLCQI